MNIKLSSSQDQIEKLNVRTIRHIESLTAPEKPIMGQAQRFNRRAASISSQARGWFLMPA